jgi:hypothetical protein
MSEVIELAKRVRTGAMNQMEKFIEKKIGTNFKPIDNASSTGCGCSQ